MAQRDKAEPTGGESVAPRPTKWRTLRRANDEVSESEDYFTASYLTFNAGTGRYHKTPLIQKWSQVDTENSKLALEW